MLFQDFLSFPKFSPNSHGICLFQFPGKAQNLQHFSFFLSFLFFLQPHQSCSCRLVSQPWQHQIRASSMTSATACSNAGSFTHQARPGIQPAPSLTLCQVLNPLSHKRNSSSIFQETQVFQDFSRLWGQAGPSSPTPLPHSWPPHNPCWALTLYQVSEGSGLPPMAKHTSFTRVPARRWRCPSGGPSIHSFWAGSVGRSRKSGFSLWAGT